MKRLLDPFDSLAPARGNLIAGYSVAYAFSIAVALLCLHVPAAAGLAVSPMAFCGLRKKPYQLLGVNPNVSANWTDPLLPWIFGTAAALLAPLVALCFYLIQFDPPHARVFAIQPSHVGVALLVALVPPISAIVNLRRLSWKAKYMSSPIDPMAVWQ